VSGEEDAEGQQRRGPRPTPPARPCAILGERRTAREECAWAGALPGHGHAKNERAVSIVWALLVKWAGPDGAELPTFQFL